MGSLGAPWTLRTVPRPARLTAGALGNTGGRLSELALVRQVHSARVVDVSEGALSELVTVEADALICNRPDRAIGVLTADCVPVLVDAPDVGWVAAIHAGRRGALDEIVPATLSALARRGASASSLRVALGPYIHAERYEVGEALYKTLPEVARHRDQSARYCCALGRLIQSQLRACGVHDAQVVDLSIDTFGATRWHSYRRDAGPSGRNLSAIVTRAGA